MSIMTTITSKRQLTIPAKIFRELKLSHGDKLIIENRNGELVIKKAKDVIKQLSGSVTVTQDKKGVNLDKAIKQAKQIHFSG
jgi:AbrB family looped-hinge helix DNA binding protein